MPPAVKVIDVPWQTLFCDGDIVAVGTMVLPVTEIVMLLLVAVEGDTQAALLIITTLTESLLAGLLLTNVFEVPLCTDNPFL